MEQKAQSQRLDKGWQKLSIEPQAGEFPEGTGQGQKMKARFSPRPEQRLWEEPGRIGPKPVKLEHLATRSCKAAPVWSWDLRLSGLSSSGFASFSEVGAGRSPPAGSSSDRGAELARFSDPARLHLL